MLLRRPISALLRRLASPSASPAADAALRRRPGLVSPRPVPFCTSAGHIAPASSALACPDPLRLRLEKERGICIDQLVPGLQHRGVCPECGGGASKKISFALRVSEDGRSAVWLCHRAKCGWKGGLQALGESKRHITSKTDTEPKLPEIITEESLQLQPLCPELIDYFSTRRISCETLQRNGVRQKMRGGEILIAFTYRRNKKLVGCKFRGTHKKFDQVAGSERMFYGLDDIEQEKEIIIVEGEMDKLSMEEAGYRNCVSVPDGAPAKVSKVVPSEEEVEGEMDKLAMEEAGYRNCVSVPDGPPAKVSKVVPSEEEDTKFKFLHNCKEYLAKASRIIIATDSDPPGQALAEEFARRLGRERCWRVKWPSGCKDANEVLMFKDRDTLKELIVNAEIYPIRGLSTGWRALDEFYKANISNIPESRSAGGVEPASNGIVVPSITTVIGQMDAISELDPNDKLYMFAIELFRNKDNREIFSALKINHVKLLWLKSQKEEHDNKRR